MNKYCARGEHARVLRGRYICNTYQWVTSAEFELFAQEVDHSLERGRGSQFELLLLEFGCIARVLEEYHHCSIGTVSGGNSNQIGRVRHEG
jgi:hypothetical protein